MQRIKKCQECSCNQKSGQKIIHMDTREKNWDKLKSCCVLDIEVGTGKHQNMSLYKAQDRLAGRGLMHMKKSTPSSMLLPEQVGCTFQSVCIKEASTCMLPFDMERCCSRNRNETGFKSPGQSWQRQLTENSEDWIKQTHCHLAFYIAFG